jgi:hypothetical protein
VSPWKRSLSCHEEWLKPFFPWGTIMSFEEKEHFSLENFDFSLKKINCSLAKLYFSLGNFFYSIGNLLGTSI